MWRRLALLIFAAAAARPIAGQQFDAPRWKSGDRWEYSQTGRFGEGVTTWSREVLNANANGTLLVQTQSGGKMVFDVNGNSIDRRGASYTWKRFEFPMYVGRRWSYDRQTAGVNSQGHEEGAYEVERVETITVPAGTFECMRVQGTTYGNWDSALSLSKGWNNSITKTTYWYCPEVGWAAKWIIESQAYKSAPWDRQESVLTSFRYRSQN